MARKKDVVFERMETTGEIGHIELKNDYIWSGGLPTSEYKSLTMSPYCEYIPISYLLNNPYTYRFHGVEGNGFAQIVCSKGDKVEFNRRWKNTYIAACICHAASRNKPLMIKNFLFNLRKWLNEDGELSTAMMIHSASQHSRDRYRMMHHLDEEGRALFEQRSYAAAITPYSMYHLGLTDYGRINPREDRCFAIPHVLAVVLPENFLYQKYKMLTENKIDLTRVVVLVDKELDTPRFHSQPFRKLYKEVMQEQLEKSGCQVWRVPHDYIMDNCFLKDFKIEGKNVIERKQYFQSLVKAFCGSVEKNGIDLNGAVESWATGVLEGNEGILNQIRQTPRTILYDRPSIEWGPVTQMGSSATSDHTIISNDDGSFTWEVPLPEGEAPYITEVVAGSPGQEAGISGEALHRLLYERAIEF